MTKKIETLKFFGLCTREAYNFSLQVKHSDIITMPPKVINQISNFGKRF